MADPWLERALEAARDALKASHPPMATVTPLRPPASPAVTRGSPHAAEVLVNQRITGRIAETAPRGSVLLAMLPDTGERYLSTFLFEGVAEGSDDAWLESLEDERVVA